MRGERVKGLNPQSGGKKRRAECDARPLRDRGLIGDAKLLDVNRQERQQQRHRHDGRERSGQADDKIAAPVFVLLIQFRSREYQATRRNVRHVGSTNTAKGQLR